MLFFLNYLSVNVARFQDELAKKLAQIEWKKYL